MRVKLSEALVYRRSVSGWDWFKKTAEEAVMLRAEARRNKVILQMKCPFCENKVRVHDEINRGAPTRHFEHVKENRSCPAYINN